jgi:hypothetical protein
MVFIQEGGSLMPAFELNIPEAIYQAAVSRKGLFGGIEGVLLEWLQKGYNDAVKEEQKLKLIDNPIGIIMKEAGDIKRQELGRLKLDLGGGIGKGGVTMPPRKEPRKMTRTQSVARKPRKR